MKLVIPKLVAALVLAAPAAQAHHDRPFRFPFAPPRAPSFRIATPRFSVQFGRLDDFNGCRPVHEHRYTYTCEREWVAPVYRTVLAGYDCRRRPIYDRVLVRAGYWASVQYRICGCGARIRC